MDFSRALLILAALLGMVTAAGCDSQSGKTTTAAPDAAHNIGDVQNDAANADQTDAATEPDVHIWTDDALVINQPDAAPDAGDPTDAFVPVHVITPDVQYVDAFNPNHVAEPDAFNPNHPAPEADAMVEPTPRPVLRVNFIGPTSDTSENVTMYDEFTQIVRNSADGDLVTLMINELCAEGADIPVTSATIGLEGNFNGLVLTAQANDHPALVRQFQSGDNLSLLVEEDPLLIHDGECIPLTITTQLPLGENQYATSIEPKVYGVGVNQDLYTVMLGDGSNPIATVRTVFDPTEGAKMSSNGTWHEGQQPPNLIPVNREQSPIANFEICTLQNQAAAVRSVTFQLEGQPLDAAFPIHYNVNWRDGSWRNQAGLPGQNQLLASPGEQFTWTANRPDHEPEQINWGGCLNFSFNLMFAEADMESLRVTVVAVELEPVVSLEARDWQGSFIDLDREALPGPLNLIVEGVPAVEHIYVNRQGFGNTYKRQWFTYEGAPNPCAFDDFGQPIENADPDAPCPITTWGLYPNVSDNRFPVNVASIVLSGRVENVPQGMDLIVSVSKKTWNANNVPLEVELHLRDRRDVELEIPLNWDLNTQRGESIQIKVLLNQLPNANPADLIPPRMKLDLLEVNATYGADPLPAHYSGYGADGQWLENADLPELGPWIIFHAPELWNGGIGQGPPQVVSIAEYGPNGPHAGENIVALNATFTTPFGPTDVCQVIVEHGSNKDVPPAESLALRVGESVYGLLQWNRVQAVFGAPEGWCATLYASSEAQVELTLANPTEPTGPELPLHFRIVHVVAHPTGMHEVEIPLLMSAIAVPDDPNQELDEHGRVILSRADPIWGYVVAITL